MRRKRFDVTTAISKVKRISKITAKLYNNAENQIKVMEKRKSQIKSAVELSLV